MFWVLLILCAGLGRPGDAQLLQQLPQIQVKITSQPFPVANARQLDQVQWTMLGTTTKEDIYCVSEAPVSQLRFVCVDCLQRNITDMVEVLNSAQDQTRDAGFPTVALRNVAVNTNWTGATIVCQANLNGQPVDSSPATVNVRYLRQPHVVDANGQGPVIIQNNGYRFFVECQRGQDGQCQSTGRRKTLKCLVNSNPPPTNYRWLKNGVVTSGNGAEITIGTEMIGQSIQCSANNGLFSDGEMPASQAVQIDPYSAAKVNTDNFQNLMSSSQFSGGRAQIDQSMSLGCQVEGNPRPVVFWRLRRPSGEIVDAACPQGFEGQYQEVTAQNQPGVMMAPTNNVRLNSVCNLRVSNYSFAGQYWCSACSYVSQGAPECSPAMDTPSTSTFDLQVQGPPMASDQGPTIEQAPGSHNAIVTVHYCADPVPQPPRDITFQIDQNDLKPGDTFENFRFEGFQQNSTVPNCYFARLGISRVSETDQYRQINLKVQNMKGARQIPVNLESLLGGNTAHSGRLSAAWIAFIVLLALCVLIAALIAICVKKQIFCFNRSKNVEHHSDNYSPVKPKNLNPSIDRTFDEPRLFAPSPAEVSDSGYGVYLSREAVV